MENNIFFQILFLLVLDVIIWKYSITCYKIGKISLSMRQSGVVLKGKQAKVLAVFYMFIASVLTLVTVDLISQLF